MDLLKVVKFDVEGAACGSIYASYEAPDFLAATIGDVISGPMAGFVQGLLIGIAAGKRFDVEDTDRIYLQGKGLLPGITIEVNQRCQFDSPYSSSYSSSSSSRYSHIPACYSVDPTHPNQRPPIAVDEFNSAFAAFVAGKRSTVH